MNAKMSQNRSYPQLRLVKDSDASATDAVDTAAEVGPRPRAKSAFGLQMQAFADDLDRQIEEILRS